MAILDKNGQPISTADLKTPQTATVGNWLSATRMLTPALTNLSPGKIAAALRSSDLGDLYAQHRLFSDMLDRDDHLRAEMEKRTTAILKAEWRIEPPRNASGAEKRQARWLEETLRALENPVEDLFIALMEAVGHGFACAELEWTSRELDGQSLWAPTWSPRPQEWFRLDYETRSQLRLYDGSRDGQPLRPFGWVWHMAGTAKSGYTGRMGILRCLVWPFLYKHYALGDFAEFLEIYGLPFITGKHPSTASDAEKESLYQAVIALGHDARAIMPQEMQIEIAKVAGSSGGSGGGHMEMVSWAEKAMSKAILGGTLTSQADGKTSTNALGRVHEEARLDIARSDARSLAATITRDVLYPLLALNRGLDGLSRCPRLIFEFSEPADLERFGNALPKLAATLDIPASWAYEKLGIPQPEEGETLLRAAKADPAPPPPDQNAPGAPATDAGTPQALKAVLPAPPAGNPAPTQESKITAQTLDLAAPQWQKTFEQLKEIVDSTPNLQVLQEQLLHSYGALDTEDLQQVMTAAFALATLKGMADVRDGQ
jgi:phage gp29-like protein